MSCRRYETYFLWSIIHTVAYVAMIGRCDEMCLLNFFSRRNVEESEKDACFSMKYISQILVSKNSKINLPRISKIMPCHVQVKQNFWLGFKNRHIDVTSSAKPERYVHTTVHDIYSNSFESCTLVPFLNLALLISWKSSKIGIRF